MFARCIHFALVRYVTAGTVVQPVTTCKPALSPFINHNLGDESPDQSSTDLPPGNRGVPTGLVDVRSAGVHPRGTLSVTAGRGISVMRGLGCACVKPFRSRVHLPIIGRIFCAPSPHDKAVCRGTCRPCTLSWFERPAPGSCRPLKPTPTYVRRR